MYARTCLQLLGHMAATTFVVKHARLHMRCLRAWLRTVYIPHRHSINRRLTMPSRVKDSLRWWTQHTNVYSGVPFQQKPETITLTTDTSLVGWGAHLGDSTIQGRWSPEESNLHINLLELRVVQNTCQRFLPLIRDRTVQILRDNLATVLCKSPRRGLILPPLCRSSLPLALVHLQQHRPHSILPARTPECNIRRPKQDKPTIGKWIPE